MKFGAVFPQIEIDSDPQKIAEYARGVEALGYDYVLTYEHILGAERAAFPDQTFLYDHTNPFHEPFVLFAYLAALTHKLEFATGILVLPQRDVRLVAKQATELNLLSGGRFRLGVGTGWNKAEAESLGTNFSDRGKRMGEQLELMTRLFREPLVDFDGTYHTVTRCGLNPLPNPIPEIWVGGTADVVLKRAAKYGSGWMPATLPEGQEQTLVNKLHGFLKEQGRDPAEFGLDARIVLAKHPKEQWRETFEFWKELGATHFRCNTMGLGFTGPAQHLRALESFLEAIRP